MDSRPDCEHLSRLDSVRVMELEARDSFNYHTADPRMHIEVDQDPHGSNPMPGTKQTKNYQRFHSQPLHNVMNSDPHHWRRSFSGVMPPRDDQPLSPWKRQIPEKYVMFQTRSPRLSFNSRHRNANANQQAVVDAGELPNTGATADPPPPPPHLQTNVPAGRYFDALQGPELEVLKDSEDLLLPMDQKWPFLLRFPVNSFGIVLGLGSQTILWKKLALMPSMQFLHIPLTVNLVLWCLALCAYSIISLTYIFKCIFYFEAVRREYYHPVRINFFFAPWVCGMFLVMGLPPMITTSVHPAAWFVFMGPLLLLELKIYGQWMSGGERRLSKVANPATHVSVVGNFVGSLLGASLGWKELATFFWAVGIAHYLVVFVTLYQRLPTNEALSKEMHPVYFLFIAAPSTASVAWELITNEFGYVSRIVFFLAAFLVLSLVVRINIFRGINFSLTWWAYTFPLTAASLAAIHYSQAVPSIFTRGLAAVVSFVAATVVFLVFLTTLFHAFVLKNLFPNDIAIAITQKKRKNKPAKSMLKKKEGAAAISLQSSDSLDQELNGSKQESNTTTKPQRQSRPRTVTISVGCK